MLVTELTHEQWQQIAGLLALYCAACSFAGMALYHFTMWLGGHLGNVIANIPAIRRAEGRWLLRNAHQFARSPGHERRLVHRANWLMR